MRRKPIEQQIVVIVGCASGIGRETALQFAERGARLVLADNDAAGVEKLAEEIRHSGSQVLTVEADVADRAQVQEIADRAVSHFGGIDTWVHGAATAVYATFEDTTPEEFKRIIDVDLMGQVYGAQAALPHLARSGDGGLICISSIEAKRALPYHSAYAAAKHGIDGFLEALRVELRHDRIPVHVTQIMPASINTPFFDNARTKIGVKPIGVPPLYAPSTVARAILHAAENPMRDIIVGGAGKGLVGLQRMSPRLLDAIMVRVGFTSQRTSQPRSVDAPNNLFAPTNQDHRVDGDFGSLTFTHSACTWLDLHPKVKAVALIGAAVGVGAVLNTATDGRQQHAEPRQERPAAPRPQASLQAARFQR
jgi:NAD(P)-dependent dehydrogenase (short-subunit alcohol dehydrogenase family)